VWLKVDDRRGKEEERINAMQEGRRRKGIPRN